MHFVWNGMVLILFHGISRNSKCKNEYVCVQREKKLLEQNSIEECMIFLFLNARQLIQSDISQKEFEAAFSTFDRPGPSHSMPIRLDH